MKTYSGKTITIPRSPETIFHFLTDFRKFSSFLPEQISDWEAGDDYCSFSVTGMGRVSLKIKEQIPYSSVVIQPADNSGFPVPFLLKATLEKEGASDNNTRFQFSLDAEVGFALALIVDRPLQQFVDTITDKLQSHFSF